MLTVTFVLALLGFCISGITLAILFVACRREHGHFRRIVKTLLMLKIRTDHFIERVEGTIRAEIDDKVKDALSKQLAEWKTTNEALRRFLEAEIKRIDIKHELSLKALSDQLGGVAETSSLLSRIAHRLKFWQKPNGTKPEEKAVSNDETAPGLTPQG